MSRKPIKLDEKDINFSLLFSSSSSKDSSSPSHAHDTPHPSGAHHPPYYHSTSSSISSLSNHASVPEMLRELARGGDGSSGSGASSSSVAFHRAPVTPACDPALSHYLTSKARGGGGSGGRRRQLFTDSTVTPFSTPPSLTLTSSLLSSSGNNNNNNNRNISMKEDEGNPVANQQQGREEEDPQRICSSTVKVQSAHPPPHVVLQGAGAEVAQELIASSTQPLSLLERQRIFEEKASLFCQLTTYSPLTTASGSSRTPTRSRIDEKRGGGGGGETADNDNNSNNNNDKNNKKETETAIPSGGLSLLESFWECGIPDVEPWDRWCLTVPRYDRQALIMTPSSLQMMQRAEPGNKGSQSSLHTSSATKSSIAATTAAMRLALTPSARAAAKTAGLDLLYRSRIPDSYFMAYYAFSRPGDNNNNNNSSSSGGGGGGVGVGGKSSSYIPYAWASSSSSSSSTTVTTTTNLPKTKEERRAEKKERAKMRQLEEKKKREAGMKVEDRLSKRHLLINMLGSSVLNPLGAETKILSQYEERFLEHQKRNFERHMAALPHQIWKREHDAKRHAEERPVLRCYRIYPIPSPQHLGKLRNFANDQRLRGFIIWTAEIEAVVVLAGGQVAIRHLDHWILEKMVWECERTKAVRVCSIPLNHYQEISFHAHHATMSSSSEYRQSDPKRKRLRVDGEESNKNINEEEQEDPLLADHEKEEARKRREEGREFVFLCFSSSIEETYRFFSEKQPSALSGPAGRLHPSPWGSLTGLWKAACLRAYLDMK